jgi:maltose alpha-D-glucosyltransferase/alpha-amylase
MINDLWYKNAVLYCLSVATYLDANGDGVGDFQGLIQRLDYLQGIGITAVWLMPFYPSPGRDDGYDVADYYGVDPKYGTLGDFVEFTHACEQRGMRVLIDLVVNHTSNQHPWFLEARRDPKSKYREWYVWSKKKPKNAASGIVFPGVQKSTWNYDDVAKQYYFHRFYEFQPDLNTSNPEVQAEILKIMGFWIQLGVSGFRMDAVPFVIAKKGAGVKPREQYDMLRTFSQFLSWRKGDAIILAEANVLPGTDMEYFGEASERLQMMFNFDVNQHLFYAMASHDARPLIKAMRETENRPATAQWGQFLRNHDELDLGRLTQRQRQTVFDAFGPDKNMQLYDRGIRRRLAPMLQGDRRRLESAYSLMMTLPGTPVIRYGDEIGMGDNLRLPERNCARTPMQWTSRPHGGFTTAEHSAVPVIDDGVYGFQHLNAQSQRRDPNSFLNWMERIVRMRKETPEIGWGEFSFLATGWPQILAMRYGWLDRAAVFVHNLGAEPCEAHFRLPENDRNLPLVNLLSSEATVTDEKGRHSVMLEPYGYRWYRVARSGAVPKMQADSTRANAQRLPPEQPLKEVPDKVSKVARRRRRR